MFLAHTMHYFRDMYKTLNTNNSSEFSLFFMELYCILKDAIGICRRDPEEAEMLRSRVTDLISREYQDPDCLRYVKRLKARDRPPVYVPRVRRGLP